MSNKIFCLALCALLLVPGFTAEAQQQSKTPKIGWLGASPADIATGRELLERELRTLGYVDGKNITFQSRYAEGKYDRLTALADELARLKVDVLVTASDIEALAAKNTTRSIPIVFLEVSDPVAAGLVDSLARPWGKPYGVHQHRAGVVWQATGVAQGNCSKALPRSGVVESAQSRLCAT